MKRVEAEGGELILRNKNGSVAIIPAKHRQEILDMLDSGCTNCLNDYISQLPKSSDYAEGGTVHPKRAVAPIEPEVPVITTPVSSKSDLNLTPDHPYFNQNKQPLPSPLIPKTDTTNTVDNFVTPKYNKNEELIRRMSKDLPSVIVPTTNNDRTIYDSSVLLKNQTDSLDKAIKDNKVIATEYDDDFKYTSPQKSYVIPKDTDIKQLQQKLVDLGLYQSTIKLTGDETKDDIKEIQKRLKVPVTGVINDITNTAITKNNQREVDGIVGSRTKAAYKRYVDETFVPKAFNTANEQSSIVDMQPYTTDLDLTKIGRPETYKFAGLDFKTEQVCSTDNPHCASWMFKKFEAQGINRDKYGLYGDAWTTTNMIRNKGGKDVYFSGYTKPSKYPGKEEVVKTILDSVKNNPIDKSVLQTGQIVEILNPSSKKFETAYKGGSGGTMTTHVGLIVKNENGDLVLEHNVEGNIRQDKIDDIIGNKTKYKITRVTQPAVPVEDTESTYIDASNLGITFNKKSKGENIADANAYRFQKTIIANKEQIKANFGLDDDDFKIVNQVAYGIAGTETFFGKAELYKEKLNPTAKIFAPQTIAKADSFKQGLRNAITYTQFGQKQAARMDENDKRDRSQGWGQVKEEELFGKEYLQQTGISNIENPDTPIYSALTTVSSVAAKYKVLSSIINEIGVTIKPKEFKALLAISHNQGFENIKKNLEQYKATGDYSVIEQYSNFRYPSTVRLYSEEYTTFK